MSLVSLRDSMRDTLATSVKAFAAVYTRGGEFNIDELKRWAVKSPCAVVGPIGFDSVEYEGIPVCNFKWGCFIVTKDAVGLPRDVGALVVLESALNVINPTQRWGDENAHMPESIRGSNLYDGKLDSTGVALWAVTWTQGYDITAIDFDALDEFLKYRSTTSISDNDATPKADDAVDLPGPS